MLGRRASIVVVDAAVLAGLVAVLAAGRMPSAVRWGIGVFCGLVGGVVAVLAVGSLMGGTGFLLLPGAAGLMVLAWYLV